ncbi:MAG: hypothetical protein ACFFCD_00205 [Promethearchaeota archaeon]
MNHPSNSIIIESYERNTPSIVERIKEGVQIWRTAWLSFILAEFLLFITLAVFFIPTMAVAHYFGLIIETYTNVLNPLMAFVLTVFAVVFYSCVLGTICGLGKEIIEIEWTRAENTLHYIKKHGLKFVVIGFILAAIIFVPMTSTYFLLNALSIGRWRGVGIFVFIITFFLLAPFILSMPILVVDDIGPVEAVKGSINIFRKDPRDVLLLFGFFATIFSVLLSSTIGLSIIIGSFLKAQRFTPAISVMIAFFCTIFIVVPVMCITFTKLYYDLTIQKRKEVSVKNSPPLRML